MKPSLQEAKQILKNDPAARIIPVSTELYSDQVTVISVLRKLKAVSNHCYLLESAENTQKWGRYSFLGFDPSLCISVGDGHVVIRETDLPLTQLIGTDRMNDTAHIKTTEFDTADPAKYIRKILEDHKSPRVEGLPPFTGGLVGYFSYDYIKYPEPVLNKPVPDEDGFMDVDLMLFEKVICFDDYRKKIILIVNVPVSDLETNYQKAEEILTSMKKLILTGTETEKTGGHLLSPIQPFFQEQEYCDMIRKAQEYIVDGDIFQVVLSNRLSAPFEGSLLDTYRVLRTSNPSPYMFYFSGDDIEMAGASPETLVKLESGVLHTFPLAGTRPRGASESEDFALEEELLKDEKELAEHNMLVDLGRNDIGKISSFGTVSVEKYMEILRFSHVMHIGSTVRGEIAPGKDAIDAVDAILPAGTLSGAPKIRACEIIAELEQCKRGIYGGAIGYIDFTGNLDTCIAIRLAFKKNGKVFVRSGAGIVADSVPEKEYRECINKAAAVVNAIQTAEGGIEA